MKTTFQLLICSLLFMGALVAQDIEVRLLQPPPNQLRQSDLWFVDLQNNTDQKIDIYLRGIVVEARDGKIVDAQTAVFTLEPKTPRRLERIQLNRLQPITSNGIDKRYETPFLRTGQPPSGTYEVCVYAMAKGVTAQLDARGHIGNSIGSDCYIQEIVNLNPPVLISPQDESAVRDSLPIFSWLPPAPLKPGTQVRYQLRIVEILGRQSPYDAMLKNNAWFERTEVRTPILQFSLASRPFEKEKKYAWQVKATSDRTPLGESEIWWFSYSPEIDTTKKVMMSKSFSSWIVKLISAGEGNSWTVSEKKGSIEKLGVGNKFVPLLGKEVKTTKTEFVGGGVNTTIGGAGSGGTTIGGEKKVAVGTMADMLKGNGNLGTFNSEDLAKTSGASPNTMYEIDSYLSAIGDQLKGSLFGWGDNDWNQVAPSNDDSLLSPTNIGIEDAISISSGHDYTLMVRKDGSLWGWGLNDYGQCGQLDKFLVSQPTLITMAHGTKFKQVSAGTRTSYALDETDQLWAWGYTGTGETGELTEGNWIPPQRFKSATLPIDQISAGADHVVLLARNGSVWTMGGNQYGQLGVPTWLFWFWNSPVPVQLKGKPVKVSAGDYHSVALTSDGTVYVWGAASNGKRGLPEKMTQVLTDSIEAWKAAYLTIALAVPDLGGVIDVEAGSNFTIALKKDSTLWMWGNNATGVSGDGKRDNRIKPTKIPNVAKVLALSSGGGHVLALSADGAVYAWGQNNWGQLGTGSSNDVSMDVTMPIALPAKVEKLNP